jgi:hypothetical protein
VLLPVLDDAKHYWVSPEEVDKLLRAGSHWLATHPDKNLITRRYLSHRSALTRTALTRLARVDDTEPADLDNATDPAEVMAAPEAWTPAVCSAAGWPPCAYPERELVAVPAARVYYQPAKPFPVAPEAVAAEESAGARRDPAVLDVTDMTGRRVVETRHHGRVSGTLHLHL